MSLETANANLSNAIANPGAGGGSQSPAANQGGTQNQSGGAGATSGGNQSWGDSGSGDMSNAESAAADQKAIQDLFDLDGASKVRFQGKEWTPEELKQSIMRQQDYTKKTSEIAKERKFNANLKSDLRAVKANPLLAEEFRKIYPADYHDYLDVVLEQAKAEEQDTRESKSGQQSEESKAMQKRLDALEGRLKNVDEQEHQAKVEKHLVQLDRMFDGFAKKYEFGVEEVVMAKAEALMAKGYQMTPAAWERLYKENHTANESKAQKWNERRVAEQLKKNAEGGGEGRGGSTPSGERRVSRNPLEDAKHNMLAALTKQK